MNQKENEQKRRRKSKAQFFEMIREVRRCQQEEKETEVADEGEEEDEFGYDHNRVLADEETGEGVSDDDEEEEEEEDKRIHAPPPPADYLDEEEEECISVVVVRPSGDDIASCSVPRVRHPSVSIAPDPGGFDPCVSERKWKFKMTKRRRSFSADALCEPARVRFAESSASVSSSSSDQSVSQLEDGAVSDDGSLLCSMVDKATLNKLTKEDLLLLWQAAESEWLAKVRALRKQRDILQLRYQHAKVTPPLPSAMKF